MYTFILNNIKHTKKMDHCTFWLAEAIVQIIMPMVIITTDRYLVALYLEEKKNYQTGYNLGSKNNVFLVTCIFSKQKACVLLFMIDGRCYQMLSDKSINLSCL